MSRAAVEYLSNLLRERGVTRAQAELIVTALFDDEAERGIAMLQMQTAFASDAGLFASGKRQTPIFSDPDQKP
jgi:hypothetical protein